MSVTHRTIVQFTLLSVMPDLQYYEKGRKSSSVIISNDVSQTLSHSSISSSESVIIDFNSSVSHDWNLPICPVSLQSDPHCSNYIPMTER